MTKICGTVREMRVIMKVHIKFYGKKWTGVKQSFTRDSWADLESCSSIKMKKIMQTEGKMPSGA